MTEKAYDDYNRSPEQYFEEFFYNAVRACKQVEHFKPDIVLGLAHAGWAPVVATRSVWESLSSRPFPPSLRTNLGREKLLPYRQQLREAQRGDFYGTLSSLRDVADFLNWLDGQTELQERVDKQIQTTLGTAYPPIRVLILDEMIAEGGTWLLAVGLLDILYPGAEVRFVDGPYFQWRDVLSKHWLEENHPELFVEMLDLLEKMRAEQILENWSRHAYSIAPGTEDIDPRLPEWRPIQPEDPDVHSATALSMPKSPLNSAESVKTWRVICCAVWRVFAIWAATARSISLCIVPVAARSLAFGKRTRANKPSNSSSFVTVQPLPKSPRHFLAVRVGTSQWHRCCA